MGDQRSPRLRRTVVLGVACGLAVLVLAAIVAVLAAPVRFAAGGVRLSLVREHSMALRGVEQSRAGEGAAPGATAEPVKAVILFIGDGMGVGQVSAASAALGGGLALAKAPVTGLLRTAATDRFVTDSAAAATALATGHRTRRGMLSMLADGRRLRTLFEAAREQGRATGVITTSGLIDATPAAFTAHAASRDDMVTVAREMTASGTQVMLGGDWGLPGRAASEPAAARAWRILEGASDRGYTLVRSEAELESAPAGPVLGLFPVRPGHPGGFGPQLAVSTKWALARLGADPAGFVLMVESEETDEAGHHNELARSVDGVRELDGAVTAALDYAANHPGTLVLVTADHDCGGLGVVGGGPADGELDVAWATTGHTAQWVPVFAFGAGAARFDGVHDNSALGRILGELLGLDGFPTQD